jgi:hypothetical protein
VSVRECVFEWVGECEAVPYACENIDEVGRTLQPAHKSPPLRVRANLM